MWLVWFGLVLPPCLAIRTGGTSVVTGSAWYKCASTEKQGGAQIFPIHKYKLNSSYSIFLLKLSCLQSTGNRAWRHFKGKGLLLYLRAQWFLLLEGWPWNSGLISNITLLVKLLTGRLSVLHLPLLPVAVSGILSNSFKYLFLLEKVLLK